MRGRGARFVLAAAVIAVVWLAATAAFVITAVADGGGWSLSCTVHGQELGGIDCLQANAVPQTHAAPGRWFGFVPLAVTWLAASLAAVALLVLAVRRRGTRSRVIAPGSR